MEKYDKPHPCHTYRVTISVAALSTVLTGVTTPWHWSHTSKMLSTKCRWQVGMQLHKIQMTIRFIWNTVYSHHAMWSQNEIYVFCHIYTHYSQLLNTTKYKFEGADELAYLNKLHHHLGNGCTLSGYWSYTHQVCSLSQHMSHGLLLHFLHHRSLQKQQMLVVEE